MDKIVNKGKKIAAHMLEAAEADIEFADGKFTVVGTDRATTFAQVAFSAYVPHNFPIETVEPGLEETAFYDPTNFTYPAGCYIAEVEVDPETGAAALVNFTGADDFGRIINPMIVEGQVHGALVQGALAVGGPGVGFGRGSQAVAVASTAERAVYSSEMRGRDAMTGFGPGPLAGSGMAGHGGGGHRRRRPCQRGRRRRTGARPGPGCGSGDRGPGGRRIRRGPRPGVGQGRWRLERSYRALNGGSYQQGWSGDVSPTFYGNLWGVQVGLPFFEWDHSSGEKDRAGAFFGYTTAAGNVTGFTRGQQGLPVGVLGTTTCASASIGRTSGRPAAISTPC
jgi:hypothetical protein